MIRPLLPIVLVLALSACGFQLRNALTLPADLGPVKVVSVDRYSPLAQTLAQALSRAGAVPAAAGATDVAVLDLLAERWGDTPISVDSFGRAQEFSLRYAVVFEVRRADDTLVVPRQSIELARDYISIPTDSIGTEGEREVLVREMRREMAASVLRRIDAVTSASPDAMLPAGQSDLLPRNIAPVAPDAAASALEALDTLETEPAVPASDDMPDASLPDATLPGSNRPR